MGLFDIFGGGQDEITSTTRPHPAADSRLFDEVTRLERLANTPREFFPGQTFAERTPIQMEGRQNVLDLARGGSPLVDVGQQALMDTLSGRFLAPDALRAAAAPVINQAVPGLNRGFAALGRGGSGAQARAVSEGISNALGNVFQGERNRMMSALGQVPVFEDLRFNPGRQLQALGAQDRAENQLAIDEAMARHNFAQTEELERRNIFLNQLLGVGGIGSTTTQVQPSGGSGLGALLGLAGTVAGAFFGGPPGAAIGGSIGSMLGSGGGPFGGGTTGARPLFTPVTAPRVNPVNNPRGLF